MPRLPVTIAFATAAVAIVFALPASSPAASASPAVSAQGGPAETGLAATVGWYVLGKVKDLVVGLAQDKAKETLSKGTVFFTKTTISFQSGSDLHVGVGDLYQVNLDTHFQHNAHLHLDPPCYSNPPVVKYDCQYHYIVLADVDGKQVLEKEVVSFPRTDGDKEMDAKPSLYFTATGLLPTSSCTTQEPHKVTVKAIVRLTYRDNYSPNTTTETVAESSASVNLFISDPWVVSLAGKPTVVEHARGKQEGTSTLEFLRHPHMGSSASIGGPRWANLTEAFTQSRANPNDVFRFSWADQKDLVVPATGVVKTLSVPWSFEPTGDPQAKDQVINLQLDGHASGMTDAGPNNTHPEPWSAPLESGPNTCQPVTWPVRDKGSSGTAQAQTTTPQTEIVTKVGPPVISGGT